MPASGSVPYAAHGSIELLDQSTLHPTSAMHSSDKEPTVMVQEPYGEDLEEQGKATATKTTPSDIRGMARMGKPQQLDRTFRQMSITSFVALATATWEIGLFIISPALVDGGRAGLVWSSLWSWICFAPIYLSMAEMASMAPIAGAQYHWVSEFAPDEWQKPMSYIAGWVSTIAWQAGNAMGIFLTGSLVQTIILVNNDSYAFPAYQGTLLAIAMVIVAYVMNIYAAKVLPYWQNIFFALHIIAYFAYIVPIWVNAPVATHRQVWGEFSNTGGWSSMGLAIMVGQLTGISEQVGIDTTAHMSEEVKNAAKAVPRTMIIVYVINFMLLFPAIVTICYHIPDLEAALGDSTTYPAIYVMRQSMSNAWISVILAIVALICCASCINYFAAVTRDLFAFARDNGLPFSGWLSTVHPRRHLPVHASQLSVVIAALLSLIYIGSPVAFYAITSLSTVSLLMCYTLSIGSVLYRRIYKPHTLPPAQFSLGRRGGIILNSCAVAFGMWAFFWSFWPQSLPITAAGFNWASPIWAAAIIFAIGYYFVTARHKYVGPVVEVEGRKQDFVR
ncbi:uncharacterized protein LTR77_007139 [Saxophila tyrrhenica]|uniref:GABA permease n=1 Tax=Saxophila tyrrhenica TaxID=1690608 RepID=A0AAV9P7W9_9PEZI|nr:hypothetical protein LTR77_007139 [Saxophila tyrrhenica]